MSWCYFVYCYLMLHRRELISSKQDVYGYANDEPAKMRAWGQVFSASFTQKVEIWSPKVPFAWSNDCGVSDWTLQSHLQEFMTWLLAFLALHYSSESHVTWAQAHINWVSPPQCIFYTKSHILDPRSPFCSIQRLWRMRLNFPKSSTKFQGRGIRDVWWYSMHLWKRRTKQKYHFLVPAICAHGERYKAKIFYTHALKLSGWLWRAHSDMLQLLDWQKRSSGRREMSFRAKHAPNTHWRRKGLKFLYWFRKVAYVQNPFPQAKPA